MRSALVLVISLLALAACTVHPAAAGAAAARRTDGETANVYLVDRDDALYKLDGRTGTTIWRQPLPAALRPAYWRLYVSGDGCWVVTDQAVLAFDSRTGRARGQYPTPAGQANIAQAVADSGTLYLRRMGAAGTTLVALDGDARARWSAPVPVIPVPLAVLDGTVFLQVKNNARQASSGLLALDAATGAVRWQLAATPAPLPESLVRAGDMLVGVSEAVAVYASHLMGVDLRTGALVWDVAAADRYYYSQFPPRVAGDTVYVNNGLLLEIGWPANTGDRTVEARDVATGALQARSAPSWDLPTGLEDGPFVARHFGADAQTLDVLGSDLTPAPTPTQLCAANCVQDWWAASGNRVWVINDTGNGTGELMAADVRRGEVEYRVPIDRTLPPQFEFWGASGAGRLYVQAFDATGLWLQAIGLRDGGSLWTRHYLPPQDPREGYGNPVVAP